MTTKQANLLGMTLPLVDKDANNRQLALSKNVMSIDPVFAGALYFKPEKCQLHCGTRG